MTKQEAHTMVRKIKMASWTEAVAIMKELERKSGTPKNWWFPETKEISDPLRIVKQ